MKNNITLPRIAAMACVASLTLLLTACGGGGGGGSTPSPTATSSGTTATASSQPSGTVTTPTYAAVSAQGAAFTLLNQYRQQCGFPAMQENTILDQAAQNHTQYMMANGGTITDTEVKGNPGFTGVFAQPQRSS